MTILDKSYKEKDKFLQHEPRGDSGGSHLRLSMGRLKCVLKILMKIPIQMPEMDF